MSSIALFGQEDRELFLGGKIENVKFVQEPGVVTRSGENDELPWAYYLSEYAYGNSIGRNATGEYSAAMFVPGDGILQGAKISALGIPSVTDGMKNVKVWVRETLDGEDLVGVAQVCLPLQELAIVLQGHVNAPARCYVV